MDVVIFYIGMSVSDYNHKSHSNYTCWDWNLNDMHLLFFYMWMTGSDYNTNPTGIILVRIGILKKCMFYLLISG
jgi:hypothetical protein